MDDGLDWVFRPVLRGVFRGESLFDGTVGMMELAMANQALDVQDENQYLYQEANKPD
jgi:hypothetical protein